MESDSESVSESESISEIEKSAPYLEAAALVEEEFKDIEDPIYSDKMNEDHIFSQTFEGSQLEESHESHHLQNEFREDSDDESYEVDALERMRESVESFRDSALSSANNFNFNERNLQNQESSFLNSENLSSTPSSNEERIEPRSHTGPRLEDLNNSINQLRNQQYHLFSNQREMIATVFPQNTENTEEANELIEVNTSIEQIMDLVFDKYQEIFEMCYEYIGIDRDMTVPDTEYYTANLQNFMREVGEKAMQIYELFEDAMFRYQYRINTFISDMDPVFAVMYQIQLQIQEILRDIFNMAQAILERVDDPEQNATNNLVLSMINTETEALRHENVDQEIIHRQIENRLPHFHSEARLALSYSTPLTTLFSLEQIRKYCRFHLRDLIEMTVRLNIPRVYSIGRYSIKKEGYHREKINADPTMQLFVFLVRISHGVTLDYLEGMVRIDRRRLSSMQLALENYLILTKSQLLNCSKFSASPAYKKLLTDNAPNPSSEECDLMEENVAFFIDGTGQRIAAPTRENFTGSEYTYSGKDKMHCLRYQVVCDLFGYIWDVAGPYGGSVHDKSIYVQSGFGDRITNLVNHRGEEFVVYGDPAYYSNDILSSQLVAAYRAFPNRPLTEIQKERNQQYIWYRLKIERTFGMMANLFKGLNSWFKNKVKSSDCSLSFRLACLFLNCYTVLNRTTNNQILRRHLDDENRSGPPAITLAEILEFWIKPEYRASASEDGAVIINTNEEIDMRFILTGITEKERINAERAAANRQATQRSSGNEQTIENQLQVSGTENENTNVPPSQ